MHEAGVNSVPLSLAQAAALAELVELEARWENLRHQPTPKGGPLPRETLVRKQMAHDAFQAKLLAYNRRYTPPHVPELLLNTAARLGKWCQAMRDLYRLIEPDLSARCPGSRTVPTASCCPGTRSRPRSAAASAADLNRWPKSKRGP